MNVERDDDRVGFYPQTETEVRYSDRWDLPTRGGGITTRNATSKLKTFRKDFLYFAMFTFWFEPNY